MPAAVAAWICCVSGRVGKGATAQVQDPLRDRVLKLGIAAGDDAERLTAGVLEITDVFGDDLPRNEAFRAGLSHAVAQLQRLGPRGALAALAS